MAESKGRRSRRGLANGRCDMERQPPKPSGKKAVPGYNSWRAMLDRCYNPRHESFRYYGARGIKVCDEWRRSFEVFFRDLGPRPSQRHTLERPTGGDYRPGNVIWATWTAQAATRNQPDRLALSRARKRSAAVRKTRKRQANSPASSLFSLQCQALAKV